MELSVYEQFARLEEEHFWFQGRRAIFFDLLERSLLETAAESATESAATNEPAGNGSAGTRREILEVGGRPYGQTIVVARRRPVT